MKKVFLVFLMSFILIISPLTVFADPLPEDDLHSEYAVVLAHLSLNNQVIQEIDYTYSHTFTTGQVGCLSFIPSNYLASTSGYYVLGYGFNLTLTHTSDVYFIYSLGAELGSQDSIALYDVFTVDENLMLSEISVEYEYFDLFSYIGDFFDTSIFYDLNTSELTYASTSTSVVDRRIGVGVIKNLPPNNYLFRFTGTVSSPFGNFTVPMGFFVDDRFTGSNRPESPDPIISYESGYISFQQASDEVRQSMNDVLSDPESTDFEKQISIQIADSQLEQLQSISDSKFSQVVNDFDSDSEQLVDSVISSGSTNILDSVSDLNTLYTDALTQATSPEQGILINAQYSVRLKQLQTVFDVNYKNELDAVIKDSDLFESASDLQYIEYLLQVESEAISIFESSDYESYVSLELWVNQFHDDPSVYRSIFEFLFEDPRSSVIQPFLTIPFSLVLYSVILCTGYTMFHRFNNDH